MPALNKYVLGARCQDDPSCRLGLFGVLDRQLDGRDFIAGDYSIADIAAVPWAGMAQIIGDERLTAHANVMAWIARNVARPATARAIALSPG